MEESRSHSNHLRKVQQDSIEIRVKDAISNIEPRVRQRHPELYKRVVDRLRESGFGRHDRWHDWPLVKSFYGWIAVAEEDDKPGLDVLLALFAGNEVIGSYLGNRFTLEVSKRNLREWVTKTLDEMERRQHAEVQPQNKQYHVVKIESESDWVENAPLDFRPIIEESVLPSIEHDPSSASVASRAHQRRNASPSLVSTTQEQFAQATASRSQKRPRQDARADKPRVTTANATTQTDHQMFRAWLSTQSADLTGPMKGVVEHAVSSQTQTLTKALSAAVRDGMQEAMAARDRRQNDVLRQNTAAMQTQLQPPVSVPPPVWGLQYHQPPIPGMVPQFPFQQLPVPAPTIDARRPSRQAVSGSRREGGKAAVDLSTFRYKPKDEDLEE